MPIRTVLCPTDFTPLSDRAVSLAARICERLGARLVLEHNLDPTAARRSSRSPGCGPRTASPWTAAKAHAAEEHLLADLGHLDGQLSREAKLTRGRWTTASWRWLAHFPPTCW